MKLFLTYLTLFSLMFTTACDNGLTSLSGYSELGSNAEQTTNNTEDQKNPNEENNKPEANLNTWPRGQFVNNCLDQANFDACIVFNNPVEQYQMPIAGGLTSTSPLYDLGIQNFAIKLQDLDNSGFLQNDYFVVDPNANRNDNLQRVQVNNQGNWMYKYEDDDSLHNQISTYYNLNEFRAYVKEFFDVDLTQNRQFIVDTYDGNVNNNAFFSYQGNGRIILGHIQSGNNNHQMSISGDVTSHEVCHGYLNYSSNENTNGLDPNTETQDGECVSEEGCIGAIHEGQADFCIYVLFKTAATGKSVLNNTTGLPLRNYENNKDNTATQQFNAANGFIHNVGALYSSMWWSVWLKAKDDNNQRDIENIFFLHLPMLDFRDTFVTGLDAINAVILDEFPNSNYAQLFADEWQRRGL